MGLFTKLFGGADGCRETMREAYEHYAKLERNAGSDTNTAHAVGLHGALGSRYRAAGRPYGEVALWAELSPFLAMQECDAIEAIAEYAVFQEGPQDARVEWLRRKINAALLAPSTDNPMVVYAIDGIMNQVAWSRLLDSHTLAAISASIAPSDDATEATVPSDDETEAFEERAAILQFDARLSWK